MKKDIEKPFGENVKLTEEELEKVNGGAYGHTEHSHTYDL